MNSCEIIGIADRSLCVGLQLLIFELNKNTILNKHLSINFSPGLDDCMSRYVQSFTNNEVKGQQLLNIRPYELEQLGMLTIGPQEIVLEAVEHLRNFHYHLDKENLQFLALKVATTAQCLCNQLAHSDDKSKIETQILSDITRMIATIKPLIGWLDRTPFQGKFMRNITDSD